jgi:hypothetical protein
MYSYKGFTPGSRTNTSRILYYSAYQSDNTKCYCIADKYDKNTPTQVTASNRLSYATRISQIIKTTKGGKTQYGNLYLGEPLNVNYLGRIEGMAGGSGMPPLNKF